MNPTIPETSDDGGHSLIVIGAGTAGLPCAIGAAAAGAKVLVIEKSHRIGGTLHYSTGHLSAAGTSLQRKRGITDTVEDHLADLDRISHCLSRADLVRQAVTAAPDAVEWLLDRGFDVDPETPRILYGHEPYSIPRTYYGRSGGLSILEVLHGELEKWQRRGSIEVWLATAVVGLRATASCIEIETEGRHGSRLLTATEVVLATGGFASSPELLAEFDGAPAAVSAASPTSTGDGLLLAQELGAAVASTGRQLPGFGCLEHPGTSGRIDRTVERVALIAQEREPAEIYVTEQGRRFIAEDDPSIDRKERALAALPGWQFWAVFDAAALELPGPRLVPGWSVADFTRHANTRPDLVMADSIPGLAEAAGLPTGRLNTTIEDFDRFAGGAADDPLGRLRGRHPIGRAPYFALRLRGQVSVSFAGIDVDSQLRVRRTDGSIIPGLSAVGEAIGCGATGGDAYCGGMMVTPALSLGRALGERLANRACAPRDRSVADLQTPPEERADR
ncbi:FAD-dependent oxidoreductase [Streptosporangium sp. NBC_01755]|uniref:FAD-dependent oxidoreductase n=1 Tax=Streptosporangium sp. NBC_01755 TaxID=2975949 RepID=UPI002DDB3720|nr:FAD-dependent oxidoreductase [Streptosporangium sp. NBC_01755]WSD00286.1 FAD-dependent oxidoreductase [Streptosporangium sp. NBC_01755]